MFVDDGKLRGVSTKSERQNWDHSSLVRQLVKPTRCHILFEKV